VRRVPLRGRVLAPALVVAAAVAALVAWILVAGSGSTKTTGTFRSSDALLNRIWAVSVETARDMVVPGPLSVDALGRPCAIALRTVIIDGVARDRCPYIGDQAVIDRTLFASTLEDDAPVMRAMLLWYARNQHRDGSIPQSPIFHARVVGFDYNAYWVEAVHDYVLYTGDRALARAVWPSLVELMDRWYPQQLGASGLIVDRVGARDYAGIHRRGSTIAYFNAGYGVALEEAATVAGWLGHDGAAAGWRRRLPSLRRSFNRVFWDPDVRAYLDSPTGPRVHPEDGNAFAVLAGFAEGARSRSALDYLSRSIRQSYGNTLLDVDAWSHPGWGGLSNLRVYPFIGYFEVLARYAAGLDDSALELVRREWGYMIRNGPKQGMWENIGPHGGGPTNTLGQSWEHGWSSGAAPALTEEVLGVRPGTPGFGRFVAAPHPSGLAWARGRVPTPHGTISFSWSRTETAFEATVDSPVEGAVAIPMYGDVKVDGGRLRARTHLVPCDRTVVVLPPGRHTLELSRRFCRPQ
jgi:hypothetical protein